MMVLHVTKLRALCSGTPAYLFFFVLGIFFCRNLTILEVVTPRRRACDDETAVAVGNVPLFVGNKERQSPSSPSTPKGVFVLKVSHASQAGRTLCSLTRFFNSEHRYPVFIFADYNHTEAVESELRDLGGGATVRIVVDTERWKRLPPYLSRAQRDDVLSQCQDFDKPNVAKCTTMKVPLGYVHMGYWRYMGLAQEEVLKDYEYFVWIDVDAYLTHPMPDPFLLMAANNLTGIFNIEAYQHGGYAEGIQQVSEMMVPLIEERRNRYLDSPKYEFFDDSGVWGGKGSRKPSVWGCFIGGRLDFFRTEKFLYFARNMSYYTYKFRTDEQAVIGAAWTLLANNDKVWYLPKHGIRMGIWHYGWLDNRQIMRIKIDNAKGSGSNGAYWFNTLGTWDGFQEFRENKMDWEEYVRTLEYKPGDGWERCVVAPNKHSFKAPK